MNLLDDQDEVVAAECLKNWSKKLRGRLDQTALIAYVTRLIWIKKWAESQGVTAIEREENQVVACLVVNQEAKNSHNSWLSEVAAAT